MLEIGSSYVYRGHLMKNDEKSSHFLRFTDSKKNKKLSDESAEEFVNTYLSKAEVTQSENLCDKLSDAVQNIFKGSSIVLDSVDSNLGGEDKFQAVMDEFATKFSGLFRGVGQASTV